MGEQLRERLNWLRANLGINVGESRIQGWIDELESGDGRDFDELWGDILQHVVGGHRSAVEEWVQEQFGDETISAERMNRLVDELLSGQRTFSQMSEDIASATGQTPEQLELMAGTNKWYKTKHGDYYVAYQLPGGHWAYFEASEEEMDSIYGAGVRPQAEAINTEADLARRRKFHYSGTVTEVTGEGNFQRETQKAIERALADGALPSWMEGSSSDEVLALIYTAQTEGKSPEWLAEQISKTKAFKDRFKGIEQFYSQGMGVIEAVTAYRQYENRLKDIHKRRGDETPVTPERIKAYLEQGHSVDDVEFVYQSFDRLQQNEASFKAFNDLLRAKGMQPLTKADQLKFLQGNAPEELYQIWEEFSVLDAARKAGMGNYLSAQEAVKIALESAGIETYESVSEGMRNAAALALRYRASIDIERFGLSADDLIDLSMGITPRSGKTAAEIEQTLQRLSKEAEGFLRKQSTPYIGFTPSGVPGARSLGEKRQEGL